MSQMTWNRQNMIDDLEARFQREQLHRAAADGDLPSVTKLLRAKYPVNRFDDFGKTPLHYAVAGEHPDVVDALLRGGANVNAHDGRVVGNTPLGEVSDTCSFEMARLLIEAGADPAIPGWMSLSAIDRARRRTDDQKVIRLLEGAAKNSRER
ncbi:MAG TPA: ankyrin repeat domain-containing protein [Tepidisphaeraceae bacterium]|jgi:ankyrin repeat protein|nr:ankyrin repeat domain-containing protein [Tepidisphaeraceae bacterium]